MKKKKKKKREKKSARSSLKLRKSSVQKAPSKQVDRDDDGDDILRAFTT